MMEAAFTSAVPLILVALGGLLSERAGVLNIALEGCIAIGAFTTAVLVTIGLSWWTAITGAVFTGILAGGILAALHLGLGANLFIAGLGVNMLLPSASGLISQVLFNQKGIIRIESQELSALPWLMIPATLIASFTLQATAYGRRIRAAGAGEEFLGERGISAKLVRMSTLLISSGLAALAGCILSLRIGAFVPGMSAGKGWIALAMIWMGFRRPLGALISCYIFSMFEIASGRGQGLGAGAAALMPTLPYLGALVILILISLKGKTRDTVL